VSSLLNPWLSKYATVGPELRAALRSYAFHEWQAGRTIDFPAGAAPKSLKLEDRCDWRALQLLHSPKAREASELLSIVEDCSRSTDPLWAAIEAQAGDALLKTGNAVEAYRRYLGLTRNFYVHRAIPLTLDYRLAAAGLLASETSPAAWRALYRSLHSEDESALDPIYRTALEELACSEIETLSPKSVQRLLREVFQPTTYFTQSVQLTRKCHRAVGFWKTLVSEAETPRDRTELYGLLLRGSLEQSRSSDARIYVQKIAAISREIPIVTSHVFWEALSSSKTSAEKIAMAERYRKSGAWSSIDERRLARIKSPGREEQSQEGEPQNGLRQAVGRDQYALPLLSVALPDLRWIEPVRVNFRREFQERVAAAP
ncbi:MAG: hypothetical protein ACXWP5_14390, partial [Bdellovibrionota bacterium]